MIKLKHSGSFRKTEKFLKTMSRKDYVAVLHRYGQMGVDALRDATPRRSGKTADSWSYSVQMSDGFYSIYWNNSNVNKGVNIAIILQYGHGTGTGGYVQGIDYINPALQDVFQQMADELWEEVCSA